MWLTLGLEADLASVPGPLGPSSVQLPDLQGLGHACLVGPADVQAAGHALALLPLLPRFSASHEKQKECHLFFPRESHCPGESTAPIPKRS